MKASRTVLAAMAAAVTLTSVIAAEPGAAKQRVVIRAKGVLNQGALTPSGFGEFVLTPREVGALVRDSGTVTTVWRPVRVRSGHRLVGHDAVSTLKGERGAFSSACGSSGSIPGADLTSAAASGTSLAEQVGTPGSPEAVGAATSGSIADPGARASRAFSLVRRGRSTSPTGLPGSPAGPLPILTTAQRQARLEHSVETAAKGRSLDERPLAHDTGARPSS
jgi:hypothetical protein